MWTRRIELISLTAGLLLLTAWGGASIHRAISSQMAIARFEADQADRPGLSQLSATDPESGSRVDFSLWSEKRVAAYKESLVRKVDAPLGLLMISKIHLKVPIYDGTDDLTLDRGVGRILGTAKAGALGNIGIGGHRDGFFRGLKDLSAKDEIEIILPGKSETYVVNQTRLVDPRDVSVLKPTHQPSLTLVTCFPFYFIGSAPQRFIVQASLKEPDQVHHDVGPDSGQRLPKGETSK
jgi:sortase A